uniref:Uncharacterized protein n=1 Tax=Anguilla anguilla TaxID=7936 RepID=A0A0E9RGN1_ANGAN
MWLYVSENIVQLCASIFCVCALHVIVYVSEIIAFFWVYIMCVDTAYDCMCLR